MAYSLVTSLKFPSTDSNGFTTGSVDTTGVDLLWVAIGHLTGSSASLTDSKGNSYTALTARDQGTEPKLSWYYKATPSVGTGHTFTVSGTGNRPQLYMLGFSGSHTSPFDQQTGAVTTSFQTNIQPGSITPPEDNCLLVTAVAAGVFADGTDGFTIDSGFTLVQAADYSEVTANRYGVRVAYLIQTTAAAKNPIWDPLNGGTSSSAYMAVGMASFKAAAAGGGGGGFLVQGALLSTGRGLVASRVRKPRWTRGPDELLYRRAA